MDTSVNAFLIHEYISVKNVKLIGGIFLCAKNPILVVLSENIHQLNLLKNVLAI